MSEGDERRDHDPADQPPPDLAESLRDITSGQEDPAGSLTATSVPFEGRNLSLDWHFARNRTEFTLGASYQKDDYVSVTALDLERMTYTAILTRRVRPTLGVTFDLRYFEEEFPNTSAQSDNIGAALRLNWQLGRSIGMRLDVEYYERDAQTEADGFQENRAMLYLTYSGGSPGGVGAR